MLMMMIEDGGGGEVGLLSLLDLYVSHSFFVSLSIYLCFFVGF